MSKSERSEIDAENSINNTASDLWYENEILIEFTTKIIRTNNLSWNHLIVGKSEPVSREKWLLWSIFSNRSREIMNEIFKAADCGRDIRGCLNY
jgi:hypothetical protein